MDSSTSLPVGRIQQLILANRDAIVCLFDQGVVSVAGFVTCVLIGRLAGAEGQSGSAELGVYTIGLSLILFLRGFQQQLVTTPYTIYHHRQSKDEMAKYRGSCLMQEFGFLLIAIIYLCIQIVSAWMGWISAEVLPTLFSLLIFLPAIMLREVARHYCFTHSKNLSVLGIDIWISVLQILALVGLGTLGILNGASAWAAIGGCSLLTIGCWYFRSGPKIQILKDRLLKDFKLNWTFAKWAVAGQFVGSLPTYLLPWLLLMAVGAEGTGFFGACMTLVGVANIFNSGMANFLTPKAAKVYVQEKNPGLKRLLVRMYFVFLIAVGAFALGLAVFGNWLAINIFGPEYHGLQVALTLFAIAKLFDGFSHTASSGLFAMERIQANFYIDVVLMLVTITAALLLIRPYGVEGAAATTLISSSTSAILRTCLLSYFLKQKSEPGVSSA